MSNITLQKLAEVVGKPVAHLIEQMEKAGLPKKAPGDLVSEEEKMQLIQFLSKNGRISLRRKTTSHIKVQSKHTGASTVSVEIRKKRSYVGRQQQAKPPMAVVPSPSPDTVVDSRGISPESRKSEKPPPSGYQPHKAPVAVPSPQSSPASRAAPAGKPSAGQPSTGKGEPRRELKVAKGKYSKRKAKRRSIRPEKVIQPKKQEFEKPTEPIKRDVAIPTTISVGELAQNLAIKSGELIKQMIGMGIMATINQPLDQETAALIVEELGHTARPVAEEDVENSLLSEEFSVGDVAAASRPPVVAVMGHVDHGKTSLLDHIRQSHVAAAESGGITQHIGAYHVHVEKGSITFLDTPGHAAFTAMRARGAHATDIVVLVVAADDGIMPQTKEAIQHSRVAKVPMVVAINKIDKDNADPEKIKGDLAQQKIVPEEWGGNTIFVNVSAKTGEGISGLLDAILLQAEVMELKATPEGVAQGAVIESALDKGRGPVATVLVQQGALKKGDILLAGQEFGRVRALLDENGNALTKATPSIPVVVIGLSGAPPAGEMVQVVLSERKAREVAEFRRKKLREGKLASQGHPLAGDNIFERLQGEKASVLNLLIKADVQGSAEALKDSLDGLSTDEVRAKIVLSGIGGINESDVDLAVASGAIIIGFNVRADAKARKAGQAEDVQIRYYSVIYEVLDDIREIMSGMLKPEVRERIVGTAKVKDVFRSSKMGVVAGCHVVEGVVRQGSPIRVLRDDVVVFEGGLESLRRHKDNVNEVNSGTECGIAVKNYEDVRPGDSIEVYERIEVRREL